MEDCQKRIHNLELLEIEDVKVEEKERIRTTSGKNVEDLKDSIHELGLFHPILVNEDNELIAGYRRLKACRELGWDIIPILKKEEINREDEIKIELQENLMRKNLSPYEIDIGLAKLKKVYEKLHPETVHLAHNKKKKNMKSEIPLVANHATYINESVDDSDSEERAERFTKIVADYSERSERSIRDRIQVGNAILEEKYREDEVQKYKEGEISHTSMLEKDRERRKREKAKEKQKELKKESKKELKIELCKICKKAFISLCPDCGNQIVICDKGYFTTRSIDSLKCNDFIKADL